MARLGTSEISHVESGNVPATAPFGVVEHVQMELKLPSRGYSRLRVGRQSMRGWRYLITTVCMDRHPWFANPQVAQAVATLHGSSELFVDAELHAWVLMPDHWHGVLQLGDHESLSALMNRFKTRTAMAANGVCGRKGGIWFSGFHDRALRDDREVQAATQYILDNPVKAGLCRAPDEYPWMHPHWS
jgi:REP element-mobilizing transposase RayT